ncbi:hypothetical protein RB620_01570 [Paenibacillus sp. LHD-117]|uniref:putative amidoligase domain-containing protein n=1 Tax=Paenibacillus sp. LHD-117 TaxID=3071412 RepID=UPI0027E0499C|nr:hypothetical protein [Paenibacillus sp. LHD-117]MDQ6418116.1 hypothetical protein [Paenibacillus sp. LHD-117]
MRKKLLRLPRTGDAVFAMSQTRLLAEPDIRGAWLLNEGAGTAMRLGEEEWKRRLRRSGLSVAAALPDERVFRVFLFHLSPLGLVRLDARGGPMAGTLLKPPLADSLAARERWPSDSPMRAVVRAATRALYALRLDVGEADVALGSDGRLAVRAVWPRLRDERQQAEALARFAGWHAANAVMEDRRLLLGADPEYALLMPSGKVAQASRYFGFGVGGAAGADAMLVGRRLLYPVAELRPEPAESPAALAANVRRLLARAAAKVGDPTLRWVAGGMPVPGLALGGHIHVSGAALTSRLLRLLDSCAAYPLALVEDPAGRGRRPRYGVLGDFRLQPHGGFEYRTLPSWLVSPAAAKAAFALALLCAREAMAMPRVPASHERYAEAYYAGDRTELAGCLDDVASAIAATDSYRGLAPYIEPLFDAARRGKTWDESVDIRAKWRIPLR